MSSVADRLWETIEPYVAAEGVELDDLEVLNGGQLVRVTIDAEGTTTTEHPAAELGVDVIAELSRGIGRLLDAADPIQGSYTLEVSSPGLERKLRRPRHYEKSLGKAIKLKTFGEIEGSKTHSGTLVAADDESFVVDVEGSNRTITYGDVSSARTVFVWEKSGQEAKQA
ncbi:MAG: ribosome maturation factor RimP [Actinomycetota bacterium]|nr:ribosome maturation factor RimP [Actinomycetota bacterium]